MDARTVVTLNPFFLEGFDMHGSQQVTSHPLSTGGHSEPISRSPEDEAFAVAKSPSTTKLNRRRRHARSSYIFGGNGAGLLKLEEDGRRSKNIPEEEAVRVLDPSLLCPGTSSISQSDFGSLSLSKSKLSKDVDCNADADPMFVNSSSKEQQPSPKYQAEDDDDNRPRNNSVADLQNALRTAIREDGGSDSDSSDGIVIHDRTTACNGLLTICEGDRNDEDTENYLGTTFSMRPSQKEVSNVVSRLSQTKTGCNWRRKPTTQSVLRPCASKICTTDLPL